MIGLDWRRKESPFLGLQDLSSPSLVLVELQFCRLLRVESMVLGLPLTRIASVLCRVDFSR